MRGRRDRDTIYADHHEESSMLNETKGTAALRTQLLARQRELTARGTRLHADQRRDVDPLSADAPDRAIQQENDQVVDSLDDAVAAELQSIDRAIARLDAGRYGICTSCGHEISAQRLKAVPYAEQCQSCMAQASS
jgi:RNA polymerase-binding protein DksA